MFGTIDEIRWYSTGDVYIIIFISSVVALSFGTMFGSWLEHKMWCKKIGKKIKYF